MTEARTILKYGKPDILKLRNFRQMTRYGECNLILVENFEIFGFVPDIATKEIKYLNKNSDSPDTPVDGRNEEQATATGSGENSDSPAIPDNGKNEEQTTAADNGENSDSPATPVDGDSEEQTTAADDVSRVQPQQREQSESVTNEQHFTTPPDGNKTE